MINLIGDNIAKEIARRTECAEYFSIIADETTDVGHEEQFSVVIRYVYEGKVEERLLSMESIEDTCSESLFATIGNTLQKNGLNMANIKGQCYDGASNMSGEHSGLQKRVRDIAPQALFTHCYAHCLNLVIVSAVSACRVAKNFFGLLQNMYVFIQTCSKRHAMFHNMQDKHCTGRPRTLKALSTTRWACHIDSINTVNDTMPAILATLTEIEDTDRRSTIVSQARGLRKGIDFEFILALKVRN